jgi:hypothetical protein
VATLDQPDIVWLENRPSAKNPATVIQSKVYARRFVEAKRKRELIIAVSEYNGVFFDATMHEIGDGGIATRTAQPNRTVLWRKP